MMTFHIISLYYYKITYLRENSLNLRREIIISDFFVMVNLLIIAFRALKIWLFALFDRLSKDLDHELSFAYFC